MAKQLGIQLIGMEQFRQQMEALTDKQKRQVVRNSLRKAGRVVVSSARSKVRRDTGQLARDISVSVSVNSSKAEADIGFKKRSFHGRFLELGTVHMAPKPFLRPALDSSREEIEQVFAAEMQAQIDKVAAKAFKGGK